MIALVVYGMLTISGPIQQWLAYKALPHNIFDALQATTKLGADLAVLVRVQHFSVVGNSNNHPKIVTATTRTSPLVSQGPPLFEFELDQKKYN
jgi:hypothetical protein